MVEAEGGGRTLSAKPRRRWLKPRTVDQRSQALRVSMRRAMQLQIGPPMNDPTSIAHAIAESTLHPPPSLHVVVARRKAFKRKEPRTLEKRTKEKSVKKKGGRGGREREGVGR